MDILDIRNLQLSYQAVYDETLCESMEDLGIIGEARDGYGDDSKFNQDTDAESFRPGKDVPKVKKFGRISRAMPPQISGHATKTVSANTRTRGEDPGAPRSQKMFKSKKMVKKDGKWVKEEFEAWVEALMVEGYDLSDYTWDDMYEIYLDEAKMPLNKERRTRIGRQIGRRTASAEHDYEGSKTAFMPKDIRDNLKKSAAKKVGEVRKMMGALKSAQKNEDYDYYDLILSHLLDEGYANSVDTAEKIMVNMSEEWRDEIVEEQMKKSPRNVEKTKQKAKERKERRMRIRYYGKEAVGHGTGEHLRPSGN